MDFELLPVYFHNFKKNLDKSINKDLEKFKINFMHFRPIILLYKNQEGLLLNELTDKIGVDKANVTRVINDLLKKEIVYKNEDKKRGYKIFLTEQGIIVAEYIIQKRKELDEKTFSNFTKLEKEQFTKLLIKYFNAMSNIEED